jgi:hypothetical protein
MMARVVKTTMPNVIPISVPFWSKSMPVAH